MMMSQTRWNPFRTTVINLDMFPAGSFKTRSQVRGTASASSFLFPFIPLLILFTDELHNSLSSYLNPFILSDILRPSPP